MAIGNASREDYEQFIQEEIVPAVDEFLIENADALVGLVTYRQSVPRGQETFKIPVKQRTHHGMELLGEYGRASYIHTERDSLSFTVQRKALSLLLTEDAIAKAVEEGVVDAVQNELNNAFLEVADEYAADLKTILLDGWGSAEDAPQYADRTFVAHDHIVDAVDLDAGADVAGGAAGSLTRKVLRQARQHVMEHGEDASVLIVSPQTEVDILELAEEHSSGGGMLLPATIEGSIGRLYGMDIFVSSWMPDTRFVVTGRRRAPIVFGERESPELRSEFRELDRMWDAQIHASWVFGMVYKWAGITVTYNGDVGYAAA